MFRPCTTFKSFSASSSELDDDDKDDDEDELLLMTDFFFLVMAIGSTFASEFLGGDADLDLLGPDSIEHFFCISAGSLSSSPSLVNGLSFGSRLPTHEKIEEK